MQHSGKVFQINVDAQPSNLAALDDDLSVPKKFSRPSKGFKAARPVMSLSSGKNPAIATWLSAHIWGTGQIYADHWVIGVYLFLMQMFCFSAMALTFVHRESIIAYLQPYQIGQKVFLTSGLVLSLVMSLVWVGNILHAYRVSRPLHRRPFRGCESMWPILFGAWWLPGLGQLLNAQTKKGFLFLMAPVVFFFSLFSTIWVASIWTVLQQSEAIILAEWILLSFPLTLSFYLICLAWSYYDAIQVNRYPGMRDHWFKRFKLALNRWRRDSIVGWIKDIGFFGLRHAFFLSLFAAAAAAFWYFLPANFYEAKLEQFSLLAKAKGMTMAPEIFRRGAIELRSLEQINRQLIQKALTRLPGK